MSHVFPTYARWNITPEKGEGSWLTATDGQKYLDFTTGIGVLNLGHCNSKVKAAVQKQLDQYWHTSNLFQQPNQEALATKLAETSGLDAAFFCNSGAEANEAAIKLAKKATGRKKIVTCVQSFHGRTFATMGATGQEKVRIGFGPMLDAFEYITFNNEEEVKAAVDENTAAIMFEIVQGEGGINPATESFLKTVQEVAKNVGALIIIDEVQTGIGRTGKPFAFQNFDFQPDIVTCAKGLGNGLPIGAMLGKAELKEHFGAGTHGSTFGGNPISTAAAIAVLDECFQDDFLQEVVAKGELVRSKLKTALSDVQLVNEVRGLGLMIGIDLKVDAGPLVLELQKEQLLVLTSAPHVMRLLPPLTVTIEELDLAIEKISTLLKKVPTPAV
ncbi:acetylornithine transaminase [Bacillus massiliigorillae]|uniref:acetylornithine transaminase n=1 Tax=Bacillus massiliigorillae TaxID=1243664 RepID=UPI0003A0506A|nr:acetylornithine transaminase [Bacillus massiliigorillae]